MDRCGKCGQTVANPFNHICNQKAFGRCETISVGQPAVGTNQPFSQSSSELVRVQLTDSVGWVASVRVVEITPGAVVSVKVQMGGGEVAEELVFDVGDHVQIPLFGNTIRIIALITGPTNASARVCASIGQADWANTQPPDFFVPEQITGESLMATGTIAVGPARLISVTGYQNGTAAADLYLMFFDASAGPVPNGTFPRWAVVLPKFPGFVDVDLSDRPIAFSQGIIWAVSSTGDFLTASATVARVDATLANQPTTTIQPTGDIPDVTGTVPR